MKRCQYKLEGLDCANCANKIQEELSKNNKLKNVVVNFAKLQLTYETEDVSEEEVEEVVKRLEPDVEMIDLESKIQKTQKSNWGTRPMVRIFHKSIWKGGTKYGKNKG